MDRRTVAMEHERVLFNWENSTSGASNMGKFFSCKSFLPQIFRKKIAMSELLVNGHLCHSNFWKGLRESYRSEILWGYMDLWWGLAIKFWGRVTCYPAYMDPLVPLFCIFSLWRPATSVKMKGHTRKLNSLVRLGELYQLVPQLTLSDIYSLRYAPINKYHVILTWRGFSILRTFFCFLGKLNLQKTNLTQKCLKK